MVLFIREAVEKVLLLCKRVFVWFESRQGEVGGAESVRERVAATCKCYSRDITCVKTGVRLYLKGLFLCDIAMYCSTNIVVILADFV